MELRMYSSCPINCTEAVASLTYTRMLRCRWLAQLMYQHQYEQKETKPGRWKALQKSTGKSWAMQHTPLSADVLIKAFAASRSLTLKKQQYQRAVWFGDCCCPDKIRSLAFTFFSSQNQEIPPTLLFNRETKIHVHVPIFNASGVQPVLHSQLLSG